MDTLLQKRPCWWSKNPLDLRLENCLATQISPSLRSADLTWGLHWALSLMRKILFTPKVDRWVLQCTCSVPNPGCFFPASCHLCSLYPWSFQLCGNLCAGLRQMCATCQNLLRNSLGLYSSQLKPATHHQTILDADCLHYQLDMVVLVLPVLLPSEMNTKGLIRFLPHQCLTFWLSHCLSTEDIQCALTNFIWRKKSRIPQQITGNLQQNKKYRVIVFIPSCWQGKGSLKLADLVTDSGTQFCLAHCCLQRCPHLVTQMTPKECV